MIATKNRAAEAVAQTSAPTFADLVAAEVAAHEAHIATCTAYGEVEARVFAKEILDTDPAYVAAQTAEGLACEASMAAWADLIEAPAPDLQGALLQLGTLARKAIVLVNAPDVPIRGAPYDTDEALKRVVRNLLQFAPADAATAPAPGERFAAALAAFQAANAALTAALVAMQTDDGPEANSVCAGLNSRAREAFLSLLATPAGTGSNRALKMATVREHIEWLESFEAIDLVEALIVGAGEDPTPSADAELLALEPEFDRRWAAERAMEGLEHSDEELDAACGATGEIVDRIEAIVPTTLDGFRLRARTIAWRQSEYDEPLDGVSANMEAALLLNDLLGYRRVTADEKLIALGDLYRKLYREHYILEGHSKHPMPVSIRERVDELSEELRELRQRARWLRATGQEAMRAKAMIVLEWLPPPGGAGFNEDFELTHSLIADVLGVEPRFFEDGQARTQFWVREGYWPAAETAEQEHAQLLQRLDASAEVTA